MRIKTQDYNDITVIELQGEIDAEAGTQLHNSVIDTIRAKKTGVVLHMSGINFIDSEGLEVLLNIKDYCHENSCQFRVAGLDENCSKILEITRLKSEFDTYIELAEAVKSFV